MTPTFGQYGSMFFTDSTAVQTGLDYIGLQPITDTTPATNYIFNNFADDQSFTATSSTVPGFNTIQFANTPATPPPTFETTNVANKTNIVFNTPPFSDTPLAITGVINIPTASTGLASLTFNTNNNGDKTINIDNTPNGVTTDVNGPGGVDTINVNSTGTLGTLNVSTGALWQHGQRGRRQSAGERHLAPPPTSSISARRGRRHDGGHPGPDRHHRLA